MSELTFTSEVQQDEKVSPSEISEFENLLDELIEQVKAEMQLIASHSLSGTQVGAALEDALDSTGKMIRPRLLLLCSSFGPLFDVKRDRLCRLAAMVELTHLASLIHDDIIDDAPFRRGEKTVQSKYGKDAAVYAGDFFISRVCYHLLKEGLYDTGAILTKTIEHMCEGEIGQDLCKFREDVTTEDYLWNIKGKTTALFRTACRIGAMEAGCSKETVNKLADFGECLGTMFQLRDDLLDFTSDEADVGKETHKDFRDGIYTMPVLMTLKDEKGREVLLPLIKENATHRLSDGDIARMEKAVNDFGGVEATRREIHRMNSRCSLLLGDVKNSAAVYLLRSLLKLLDCC